MAVEAEVSFVEVVPHEGGDPAHATSGAVGVISDRAFPRSAAFPDQAALGVRFVTASAYNVDGGWTAGMTKAIALI